MENYLIPVIETISVIAVWFLMRLIIFYWIKKRHLLQQFSPTRKKLISKSILTILNVVGFVVVIVIWSIDQSQILLFISSILTILGVAFFAQWSHLSNITSGIIIFFNSDTKIGDQIRILDKEFDMSGEIIGIGPMFLKIKVSETEIISVPNNILLQKPVKINSGN